MIEPLDPSSPAVATCLHELLHHIASSPATSIGIDFYTSHLTTNNLVEAEAMAYLLHEKLVNEDYDDSSSSSFALEFLSHGGLQRLARLLEPDHFPSDSLCFYAAWSAALCMNSATMMTRGKNIQAERPDRDGSAIIHESNIISSFIALLSNPSCRAEIIFHVVFGLGCAANCSLALRDAMLNEGVLPLLVQITASPEFAKNVNVAKELAFAIYEFCDEGKPSPPLACIPQISIILNKLLTSFHVLWDEAEAENDLILGLLFDTCKAVFGLTSNKNAPVLEALWGSDLVSRQILQVAQDHERTLMWPCFTALVTVLNTVSLNVRWKVIQDVLDAKFVHEIDWRAKETRPGNGAFNLKKWQCDGALIIDMLMLGDDAQKQAVVDDLCFFVPTLCEFLVVTVTANNDNGGALRALELILALSGDVNSPAVLHIRHHQPALKAILLTSPMGAVFADKYLGGGVDAVGSDDKWTSSRLAFHGILRLIRCNRVTSLDLNATCMNAEMVSRLADAMTSNTSIKLLYLVSCLIDDEGAITLAKALRTNQTLTDLVLFKNNVGDLGATALAEALTVNSSLTYLGLDGNPVGLKGCDAFAECLKRNRGLKQLHLDVSGLVADVKVAVNGNVDRWQDRILQPFKRALEVNQALVVLNLPPAVCCLSSRDELWAQLERNRGVKRHKVVVEFNVTEDVKVLEEFWS